MKLLYFDCFSGASGDMILGALLDAGLPLDVLREALGSLGVADYELRAESVLRAGVSATRFDLIERAPAVAVPAGQDAARSGRGAAEPPAGGTAGEGHGHGHDHHHAGHSHHHGPDHGHAHVAAKASHAHGAHGHAAGPHAHRSLPEILALIEQSRLSPGARHRARQLFERLAEAEAAIHQMPVERVHLHEVGALDSIIDIVGAVFAIEWFAADRVVVSPMNVGGGMVRSAHGVFPVPAPATLRLLGDAPIYSSGLQAELLTPTGALLLSGHASAYGPVPAMRVERVGYGAGEREFAETPNVLRVLVGRAADQPATERIVVLACEIDDMNPQIFGVLMDRLYDAGALEVFYAPVQMKKNRPGTLVTIIAAPERREALATLVFRETTTIGIRYQEMHRQRLEREIVVVETPLGPVRFKVARDREAVTNASPEFDDCARLAAERQLAVKDVQAIAVKAWLERA
jgi:pyridinium-3,5-bisthiocarboxylic acid mononucleotide nickel chelatase